MTSCEKTIKTKPVLVVLASPTRWTAEPAAIKQSNQTIRLFMPMVAVVAVIPAVQAVCWVVMSQKVENR